MERKEEGSKSDCGKGKKIVRESFSDHFIVFPLIFSCLCQAPGLTIPKLGEGLSLGVTKEEFILEGFDLVAELEDEDLHLCWNGETRD